MAAPSSWEPDLLGHEELNPLGVTSFLCGGMGDLSGFFPENASGMPAGI